MPRQYVSERDLHNLIKREFEARRPPECAHCTVPNPIRTPRLDAFSGNWMLTPKDPCARGCNAVLSEIALELRERFDLL
jgi:hypothetical protein